jgi:hypothetical protein
VRTAATPVEWVLLDAEAITDSTAWRRKRSSISTPS